MIRELLLIAASLFTIISASGVVLSKNAIHSAFSLALSIFGLASLYLLWGATFISMIQILVYAGAIVVLFVFVVMLLNLERFSEGSKSFVLILVGGASAWFFSLLLLQTLSVGGFAGTLPEYNGGQIRVLAKLLFTQYLWPFEVLTVFLLALIVGIYLLAKPEREEA